MKDISKRIKELREENNLSQNELAEKLFVTRQAVSSWETKKTRPDIETLEAISKVFSIDLMELLYGKEQRPFDKRKLVPVIIFGAAVLTGLAIRIFAVPYALELKSKFIVEPYYTSVIAQRWLLGCSIPLLLSLLSLNSDIYIKNKLIRYPLLITGAALSILYLYFSFFMLIGFVLEKSVEIPFYSIFFWMLVHNDYSRYIPLVSGAFLYLGAKKSRISGR